MRDDLERICAPARFAPARPSIARCFMKPFVSRARLRWRWQKFGSGRIVKSTSWSLNAKVGPTWKPKARQGNHIYHPSSGLLRNCRSVHYPAHAADRSLPGAAAKWVKSLIIAGRSHKQLRLAPTNRRGVQLLLKSLHSGQAIALLPDQAPKSSAGVWADFFGRPAYTMPLVRKLQQSTGASLISVFSKRLPCGTGFELEFDPAASENFDESALNRLVENLVRRCPEKYLWSYNRHKVPRFASQQPGAELSDRPIRLTPAATNPSPVAYRQSLPDSSMRRSTVPNVLL